MIYTIKSYEAIGRLSATAAENYLNDANKELAELWDGLEMMDRVIYDSHNGELTIDGTVIGVDSDTGWIKVKDDEGQLWIDSDSGYWTYGAEIAEWEEGI